ncbi:MAG: transcription antitermination factor NusB [Gemmatimonadota bacterium]|jgi:N utilization substance protein B|nr:transcription antitermination factor NusB [Gemmatimonadota bacterium]
MTNMQDDAFWDTPVQEPLAPRAGRRTRGSRAATKVERLETRGRARALQALYAADLRDLAQLRKIATHVFDDLAVDPEERQFASRLVATVAEKGAAIDADLAQVTNNWRLDRLGAIERSVLRLAAAELDRNETPVKVVLQEAVHLAERYGTTRSARFVNGVLDAYARRLGLL